MKKIILFGYLIIASFGLSAQNQWNIVGESVRTVPDLVSDSNFVLSAPSRAALRQGQANWVPASSGGSASILVYTALLTQSGTSAPVATVLENTLDGTVVWTYEGVGDYYATLAGAFDVTKTIVQYDPFAAFGGDGVVYARAFGGDIVGVQTKYNGWDGTFPSASNDMLTNAYIRILVYP